MAISQEMFNIFEDIVGPENISNEPAILDTYAYQWGAELFTNTSFLPRSGAVLLPENKDEIQSIVRACNKYNVRYKAFSTGWGFYSALGLDEEAIQIDLRRMNKIIEINEKNMYAVVEPYVTCAQLQGELMKMGLNCNVIGAGCNTSAMPIVAHQGLGHSAVSTSYGDRNVLGVEWVLPDGELLKLGALGSGSGWFCGDGPGPSLRGVLRGPQTVMGGLGIFTKAATKVYHWPGPSKPELEGVSPYYRLSEFPKNFRLHYPFFPDYDKFRDAIMEIAESEIAFLVDRIPTQMLAQALSGNNDEGEELLKNLLEETKGRPGFVVVLSADSEDEIEYKEKVFLKILDEQSGELLSYIERDEVKREYLWTETRVTMAVREVFRATGRFLGTLGDSALFQNSLKHMISTFAIKEEYQKKKLFRADDGSPDCMWGIPIEGGHTGHCENLVQVHPTGESWKALMEFTGRCEDLAIQEKIGTPVTVWGDMGHDKFGPHLCNYHDWLRKLKKAYDPKGVSESAMYISAKKEE
jgi:glycolate oxidase